MTARSPPTMATASVIESELRSAKSKRALARAACTRAKTYLDRIGDRSVSVIELQNRLSKLRECWQQFEDAQSAIEILEAQSSHIEEIMPQEDERRAFEDTYFAVETNFQELIATRSGPTACPGTPTTVAGPIGGNSPTSVGVHEYGQATHLSVRLPRIELPSFSGSYEDWRPFFDTFNSMIHENAALPPIQKLHYLKASLKGEAAGVISALQISANNYEEAWSMLKERYDNQRAIIHKHVKAIIEQPAMLKETHGELRQLVDGITKQLRALKALERPIEHWDDLLLCLTTIKLSPVTNKEWETSATDSRPPTFKQLTDFLAHRCRALEAIERKPLAESREKPSKRAIVSSVVTDKRACAFCKGDHPIYCCAKFLELSIDQRFQEVKKRNLCLNCIKSTEHRAKQCHSGGCKKCTKKHNTLLHFAAGEAAKKEARASTAEPPTSSTDVASTGAIHFASSRGKRALLSTALVNVRDSKGNTHVCRALLDSGAELNFVTTDFVKRLGIKSRPASVPFSGIGNSNMETHSAVKITVHSRLNAFKTELNYLVLR